MRRQDRLFAAPAKIGTCDRVQPIGIDHHRDRRFLHQPLDEFAIRTESRPDSDHCFPLQFGIVERFCHQFRRRHCSGRCHGDKACARAQGRQSGHRRRTRLARRASHHQHVAEIAFVGVRLPRPEQMREIVRLGNLDVGLNQLLRNPDVRDDQLAHAIA